MNTYPTAEALSAMGETLQRDVCLWSALLTREYCNTYGAPVYTRSEREPIAEADAARARSHHAHHKRPAKPRTYASRYVGVTVHRDRWVAQWGPKGCTKGKVFPKTPEGELAAAWERARVLGLSEPEVRE
jgi:hypothetical protein